MKSIIISIIIAVSIVVLAIIITKKPINTDPVQPVQNVSIVDGVQIIEITAKGGYIPFQSKAKAGIPTIVRMKTKGTYDCSAAVSIPKMAISKFLPGTGITDLDIGIQEAGILNGSCSMGMYPFEIEFTL